jgi:hypothetical protein
VTEASAKTGDYQTSVVALAGLIVHCCCDIEVHRVTRNHSAANFAIELQRLSRLQELLGGVLRHDQRGRGFRLESNFAKTDGLSRKCCRSVLIRSPFAGWSDKS